ncbi:MAG: hypothetical protein C3F13_17345 [Anaerolineales bacterium]|nr:hypothetical protein [Anaerolineae bacterium]PWB50232.1 MAG: hypothetical protein C3F13_17345 [Anaerolineales bacterium]
MSRKITGILYILSFAILPWLVFSPSINLTTSLAVRLGLFAVLSLIGAYLFRLTWPRYGWAGALLITCLGYTTAYKLSGFIPDVSSYPFSLGWSEGSRYYYASLWLSNLLYGISLPPSVLHPSRYLLQAVPLLIPESSIWLSRFWQVMLWLLTTTLTSYLLVRRLRLSVHGKPLVIILSTLLWGFLFLFQGPVYYHLQLMLILILWGFDSQRFWRSLILVLAASLWAGISRVNWLPVPGLLASALYILEVQARGKPLIRYLVPPAIWAVAGTFTAYASQLAYQSYSGNPQSWFGSSFSSDLLWYRLLPNPTYPMGILLSAILVSLPILGLILLRLVSHWREFHILRLIGLTAILAVLFAGGVIVSVKIGGGSNLHNLDAYLSLLMVIGSYIYFDRFLPDQPAAVKVDGDSLPRSSKPLRTIEALFLAGAIIIPIYFTLSTGGPIPKRDYAAAQVALSAIKTAARQAIDQGGEVLFITQRQLLTFKQIPGIPLVPDDELVFLMEMAMGGNADYLNAFYANISHQRYDLIVSEPLVIQYQGRSHSFGEENDAWVKSVSEPVLCFYEPGVTLESVGVVLYTPRSTPCR